MPDRVVVLVGRREIGIVPVHPVAEPLRLLRLHTREGVHPLLAVLHEPADAVRLDVPLRSEAQVLFDLDFHPQALAVETVLVALLVALHRAPAEEQVFVRPAPGVVDTHRIVRRDRPVDERVPFLGVLVPLQVALDDALIPPPVEQALLDRDEIDLRRHSPEGAAFCRLLCQTRCSPCTAVFAASSGTKKPVPDMGRVFNSNTRGTTHVPRQSGALSACRLRAPPGTSLYQKAPLAPGVTSGETVQIYCSGRWPDRWPGMARRLGWKLGRDLRPAPRPRSHRAGVAFRGRSGYSSPSSPLID